MIECVNVFYNSKTEPLPVITKRIRLELSNGNNGITAMMATEGAIAPVVKQRGALGGLVTREGILGGGGDPRRYATEGLYKQ
jgi:hypothetical protein